MPYARSAVDRLLENRQDVIMFKIDRIQPVILPETRYEVSPDFDPEEYMGNRWGILRVKGEPEDVVFDRRRSGPTGVGRILAQKPNNRDFAG